jgi:hypothetical protein
METASHRVFDVRRRARTRIGWSRDLDNAFDPARLESSMIGDRWGVTLTETERWFPCDDFVPDPGWAAWRGVSARASTEDLWSWLKQIRLAPYSYDCIDNLGRRSPQRLSSLSEPTVGEPFTTAFGRPSGRIVAVSKEEHLTGRIMGTFLSYVLVPDHTTTRLLLKVVSRGRNPLTPLLCIGDLVMARRQLLNISHLAEMTAADRLQSSPTREQRHGA